MHGDWRAHVESFSEITLIQHCTYMLLTIDHTHAIKLWVEINIPVLVNKLHRQFIHSKKSIQPNLGCLSYSCLRRPCKAETKKLCT